MFVEKDDILTCHIYDVDLRTTNYSLRAKRLVSN